LLAADPNDYAVSDKNRITVLAGETLGHYADWLQIKTNSLRKANRMRYGKPVVIGKKIKLIFDQVTPAEFENARLAFHRSLQETYFSQYLIASTQHHKVRRGESIWELTQQKYNIPLWLLMQYNPDLGLQDLKPGDKIVIPIIQAKIE
jgi:membrane-bound lytic murein transglycosylase D